jgi:hypothetical protein
MEIELVKWIREASKKILVNLTRTDLAGATKRDQIAFSFLPGCSGIGPKANV